jgi:hypothetical protein
MPQRLTINLRSEATPKSLLYDANNDIKNNFLISIKCYSGLTPTVSARQYGLTRESLGNII